MLNSYVFFLPLEVRATTVQQAWVASVALCESGGDATIKVLDSNDRYSYGILQFQMATWLTYRKEFHTTPENIYDPELQQTVALYILNNGGWRNWYTCAKKAGPYPLPDANGT